MMLATTPNNPEFDPNQRPTLLSKEDIERLLNEVAPRVRIDVLDKIAKSHANRRYSLQDLAVAEQILRILVKDTEVNVREALSVALQDNPYIPNDIVLSLSSDVDSVALPVLEKSPVLTDGDLITLIQSSKNIKKQAIIATRKPLSTEVSSALVATHSPEVVSTLTQNLEAEIAPETYNAIIRDHAKNQNIMRSVADRPNLPVTIVEKVLALVSDSIANNLKSKYNVATHTITTEADKTREIATLKLVDGEPSKQDVEKLIDQLQAFHRLTPSIILTSLCRGNLYFFETSLARLSNIPTRNAQMLIHDKGGLGFQALYNKAGLPEKFFAACRILLDVVADIKRNNNNLKGAQYTNEVIHGLLSQSAGKNIENLSYIIALIRQSV